jgi:hypothetical protein
MKWSFRLGKKEVSYTIADTAVAVRPSTDLRESATRAVMTNRFGLVAKDDSKGGKFGIDLPSRNRNVFERAGWLFVEPQAAVARAASERASIPDAEVVRQVLINRAGELLITTNLVTVQLPEELTQEQALGRLKADQLRIVRQLGFAPNLFEARLPARRPLPELIAELQSKTDTYRFVNPVLLQVLRGRMKPTDPMFDRQWQHTNDGSDGGKVGADIHSEAAWDLTRGVGPQRPVRIAVIDNGMQISHPDLKDGIKSGGYFEDDGNGGSNFVRFQPGMTGFPSGSHGTFCMGMAGARMNNGRGGCGSAPEADLMAVACLSDQVGSQATLARAVAYAYDPSTIEAQATAADGADVIVCSLGPDTDWDITPELDLAISGAARGRGGLGVPVFWAVSNFPVEVSLDEVCSHADVMAVGRSNRNDLEDGSAFGPKLEFLAPGRDVFSTTSGGNFDTGTGTSYAAPLSAGVGALVISRHPDWTAGQVRQRLRDSCDKVGGVVYNVDGHHDEYGFGRLNAEKAVK